MDANSAPGGDQKCINHNNNNTNNASQTNDATNDVLQHATAAASPSGSNTKPQPNDTSSSTAATTTTTTPSAGKGGKGDRKAAAAAFVNFEDKIKVESELEFTELLGSVTTHNCPGTRTSARVIQKMKQDQIRPVTPPPSEREQKKEEKSGGQKTPSQVRANKPTWTNLERNHFFDALNDFGKDFESLGNYINAKLKRKSATDIAFKTKDQVRQHYYQTYHKICKYIKFSDEVKKPAQELYALINYGEMRRKLQFVTDKHFMKLRSLVYQGHITVRCKGKNIRIKTPSCKALRRLNQLDDSLEDIRLPSKIDVIVSPANMESYGRVQTIAQNPRARTTVPLHKKLVNFIKTFQYKWRSPEAKLANEEAKLFRSPAQQSTQLSQDEAAALPAACYRDTEMCFLPKPGVAIHRPLLSITEYLSSVSMCLAAYEERMGVKVRGETLSLERNGKRQRTESGSEKRSPDAKKHKQAAASATVGGGVVVGATPQEGSDAAAATIKEEQALAPPHSEEAAASLPKAESSSGDELSDEINELLSDTEPLPAATAAALVKEDETTKTELSNQPSGISTTPTTSGSRRRGATNSKAGIAARTALTFKPLLSDDIARRIRRGWTVSNAADITIGDLYVVLGQDSRLELEYYWTQPPPTTRPTEVSAAAAASLAEPSTSAALLFAQKQNGMPYNPSECDDPNLLQALSTASVGNKLKHLLLIANLSERIRKRQCSCGHTCSREKGTLIRTAAKNKIERDLAAKTFVSNKTFASGGGMEGGGLFRQPIAPIRRPIFNMDPVKQLTTLTRQKMSRQVLVQRLLLPGGGGGGGAAASNHSYDLLDASNLQNNLAGLQQNQSAASILPPSSQNTSTSAVVVNAAAATAEATTSHVTSQPQAAPPDLRNFANAALPGAASSFSASSCDEDPHPNSEDGAAYLCDHQTKQQLHSLPSSSSSSSLSDSAFDECSNNSLFSSMSPMHLIRDSSSNSRWLEENLNDFSLTSLLGHLDEINATRDILDPSSNLSVISESSVDYMHKFQEITALMQSQDKD